MKRNPGHGMSDPASILSADDFFRELKKRRAAGSPYYAMYSSWAGGMVTEPALMLAPIDDHVVHRGDGVFETLKCVNGALYNLGAHLDRLQRSAGVLGLVLPESVADITTRIVETVRAGGRKNCAVRVIVSRGPGSLGVNPYDCPEPQLYVIAAELPSPFMKTHPGGARAGLSAIPARSAPLARIKSCNYLPNVLMKQEAMDRGLDFVIALDENAHVSEGAIENIALIDADRRLVTPAGKRLLDGTTLKRILELAQALDIEDFIRGQDERLLSVNDVLRAREILVFGTTIDVTAVVAFEGQPVGDGTPGPGYEALSARLHEDILRNPKRRTPAF